MPFTLASLRMLLSAVLNETDHFVLKLSLSGIVVLAFENVRIEGKKCEFLSNFCGQISEGWGGREQALV